MKLDMKKGVSSETLAEMRNVDMREVTLPVNGGTVSTRICKQYSKGSCQKNILNIFSILHNSFSKHSFFLVVLPQTARAV